jgi:hypothetical protein
MDMSLHLSDTQHRLFEQINLCLSPGQTPIPP